jgi:arsenate reductase
MKPKVAFICVHNSCRSQIAEALGKLFAFDIFESYSAGTELKQVNQDAVKVVKELYGVDIDKNQYSKLITDLPDIDITIKMGCNVSCPIAPSDYEEDWGLEDPTGKGMDEFIKTARLIEVRIKDLAERIKNNKIDF